MSMYGKLLDYKIVDNEIVINFKYRKAIITVINDNMINFFVPCYREERNSKAVETLKISTENMGFNNFV